MFNIAVENSVQDNYFTEKIIDCFASKTIPIYYGCPNIGDWFDLNGVITFDSLEELELILSNLDSRDYKDRKEYINKNFEISKNFFGVNDLKARIKRRFRKDFSIRFII
tara:strand:- start:1691 stop:2017 length:327 start_codon:yes stop_codon:yes gene_type:complete